MLINDVISEAIELTQPRWEEQALAAGVNIEVRSELGRVPSISGDEDEIRGALVTLLNGAIEAIRKSGTITVSSEVQENRLVIMVVDDGVTMTEEERERCLEEPASRNLCKVYETVCSYEGKMDVQSEAGRGTSVTISLPLDSEEPAPSAPKSLQGGLQSLRLLVVEDEPLVREVLTFYLSEDQHDIVLAENGRDGLKKFQQECFDLVLTDRAMPDMNGDELAVEIKKMKPGQKVILLTGFSDLVSREGDLPPGVDLVVGKPFTLGSLRTAIAKVMES